MIIANFEYSSRTGINALVMLALVTLLVLLSACGAADNGAESTATPTVEELPTAEPTSSFTAEPTVVEPTSEPIAAPTTAPVVEATPDSAQYFPTPEEQEQAMQLARQLIDSIPQPIAAPEGRQVAPCEGVAPLLCVQTATGET